MNGTQVTGADALAQAIAEHATWMADSGAEGLTVGYSYVPGFGADWRTDAQNASRAIRQTADGLVKYADVIDARLADDTSMTGGIDLAKIRDALAEEVFERYGYDPMLHASRSEDEGCPRHMRCVEMIAALDAAIGAGS